MSADYCRGKIVLSTFKLILDKLLKNLLIANINNERKKSDGKNEKKCDRWKKALFGTQESAGAVIRRWSVNKIFGKNAQSSKANACAEVSF